MADLHVCAEGLQKPPPPGAKHDLLLETKFRSPSVKLTRDASVGGAVHGIVAVQQVKGHAADFCFPDPEPQVPAGQFHRDPQPLALTIPHRENGQLARIIVGIELHLPARGIERLPEVALLVKKADARHRDTQIAGCFEMVPGQNAQPSRIDGKGFAQTEFHTEISDSERHVRVSIPEPPDRVQRFLMRPEMVLVHFHKRGIAGQSLQTG